MPQEICRKYADILDLGKQQYEQRGVCEIDGVLSYVNADGYKAEEGWIIEGRKRYYCVGDGKLVVGNFHQIDISWYFFDVDGTMQRGLKQIGNDFYYFGKDGSLWRGLQQINGEMWHFDETGRGSDAGWIQVGSRKYYCFGQGRLATGTVCIDGSNFEFETTGVMK